MSLSLISGGMGLGHNWEELDITSIPQLTVSHLHNPATVPAQCRPFSLGGKLLMPFAAELIHVKLFSQDLLLSHCALPCYLGLCLVGVFSGGRGAQCYAIWSIFPIYLCIYMYRMHVLYVWRCVSPLVCLWETVVDINIDVYCSLLYF